ncbi:mitochondrial carrier protein, putative [Talaromyces stipitatus ATCC 10500]|uniref:Mitochondrial carrier protein, putative n=1 Tax=Talaromyces stipitatus (strain ATCC 10500 / CBS 375.48 / QM 6759 / NRRL 1006) TaxID=441959 RepID=B8LUV2_TALSN|nr:mitochondrial carrier protein, putative [Talaromyces stipitatus ATCC 10500]EED24044.1 mitochondrial carrier protein, putative [Talaromyces stipitatus ATCC 10500]
MHNSNTDIWLAGAIAAFTVDFIVYPLDTLKTRIQSPRYKELYTDAATGAVQRRFLFRGLYQGIWSVVVATIPSSGAFFTTYEGIKYILNSAATKNSDDSTINNKLAFKHSLPTPVINGIASSAAECVSCFILTPAEVLKQNAQMVSSSDNNRSRGKSSTTLRRHPTMQVLSTFRAHPTHLWRGYGALVARNLPFTAMQFPLFEYLRERTQNKWHQKQQTGHQEQTVTERALITALSAGLAGGVAAVVTTPIDVVKTRIMLNAATEEGEQNVSSASRRRGAVAVGKEVYRKEGMRGLFKGVFLRGGWTSLGLGLYLSAYESGRMYFEKRREDKDK